MSEKEKAKQEESQRLQQSMMTDSSIMMEEDESRLDLKALERKYRIRDFPLFIKSVTVITAVIILFFIHPFVTSLHLNISWIALLGALMLLVRFLTPPSARPPSHTAHRPSWISTSSSPSWPR